MMKSNLLVLSLLASPVAFTACKNDAQEAQIQTNIDRLKDAETQMQNLRAENDKLRQDNEALKIIIAKMEGRNTPRQASAATPRTEPRKSPAPQPKEQTTPAEREKQAMRQGAIGGDSFK